MYAGLRDALLSWRQFFKLCVRDQERYRSRKVLKTFAKCRMHHASALGSGNEMNSPQSRSKRSSPFWGPTCPISLVHPFEMPVEPLSRPLYDITLVRRLGNAMPFVRVIKQFSFDAVMFER